MIELYRRPRNSIEKDASSRPRENGQEYVLLRSEVLRDRLADDARRWFVGAERWIVLRRSR